MPTATYKSADAHQVWMSLSARSTLYFESVEVWIFFGVDREEVGDAEGLRSSPLIELTMNIPRQVCSEGQCQHVDSLQSCEVPTSDSSSLSC